jgi:23S rRNA U2552 (ribose-2'-O)-methylase RlmE/FtsJ
MLPEWDKNPEQLFIKAKDERILKKRSKIIDIGYLAVIWGCLRRRAVSSSAELSALDLNIRHHIEDVHFEGRNHKCITSYVTFFL